MKNWKTTFWGSLASVLALASHSGVSVGHVGNTDFVTLGATISAIIAATYMKDRDVTGAGEDATRVK